MTHDENYEAIMAAWMNPGPQPRYHGAMQKEVRRIMPVLAEALDRASLDVTRRQPAPPQPEEPTELGVKARVREGRFLRLREGLEGSNVWFEEGTGYRWTWDDLCEMGPVTVIPDQGWTVPDDTPEVPDRITEWPEDDTALRAYPWRDTLGIVWRYGVTAGEPGWSCGSSRAWKGLIYGPWTRVTDA